ncbi:hypothetical protein H4R34_003742 [Dimargaris verticillata]|uniref:DUF7707 domain-containing protein n=1 Tax=Dimargaris verticillata TaxID=2761393 RepID=A0A9W8EBR7_9FUNG|nr:hypothetical protein H4R34_003742 [Dimargaris verticillata]
MKVHLFAAAALCLMAPALAATDSDESSAAPSPSATKSSAASSASPTLSVSKTVKKMWCSENNQFCNNVCLNMTSSAKVAKCDPATLNFECVCDNDESPNQNEYTFPVKYYACTQSVQDCQQKSCKIGDTVCHQKCQKDCSAINDPFAGNVSKTPSTNDDKDSSDLASDEDVFDNSSLMATANVAFVAVLVGTLMCINQF